MLVNHAVQSGDHSQTVPISYGSEKCRADIKLALNHYNFFNQSPRFWVRLDIDFVLGRIEIEYGNQYANGDRDRAIATRRFWLDSVTGEAKYYVIGHPS